jgi:hypothetical protein
VFDPNDYNYEHLDRARDAERDEAAEDARFDVFRPATRAERARQFADIPFYTVVKGATAEMANDWRGERGYIVLPTGQQPERRAA